MEEIRLGLMNDLDVTLYANQEYDWEQMKEIRLGLKDNLDVLAYARPEYNIYQMKKFVQI